ncbi:MAG: hypothetical protein FKY71_14345 [Spiribacter salinus]|uniref:DUF3368 domain-containing protein n=1 Tax=Spiribacter salinus TaxID=1335746 RepID=A0A540VNK2_9GAMM|nr:MAG: hypothetical protein FKY71_14345 [Spiribacter salinus]
MPVLISDANVLIDMEVGELLQLMFSLPHEFATPDILYADELEEHHPYLPQLGLQLRQLDGDRVNSAMDYHHRSLAENMRWHSRSASTSVRARCRRPPIAR